MSGPPAWIVWALAASLTTIPICLTVAAISALIDRTATKATDLPDTRQDPPMTDLRPEFIEHASPEAITDAIRQARTTRDQWRRHVLRLEDLLVRRNKQIANGTWPATEATDPGRTPSQ